MSNDKVTYDSVTSYHPHNPYRSSALSGPDLRALYGRNMRQNPAVQVIKDHGDTYWTDATLVRVEDVPHSEGAMQRYIVTLADGTEHMVSMDRIRVRP